MPASRLLLVCGLSAVLAAGYGPWARAATPDQLNRSGLEQLRQQQPRAAIETFREALRLLPDSPVLQQNLSAAYLAAAISALEARDFAAALEFLRLGGRFAEDDYRFPCYIGHVHLRRGDLDQAEVALNECVALAPERAEVHQLLGRLYYAAGRMPEAYDSLTRARELDPANPDLAAMLEKVRTELAVERGMSREQGGRFMVATADDLPPDLGAEILDVLDDAYVEVGSWLNSFPDLRIPVLIYGREDFAAITGSPRWVGGVYDGKIRIPLGGAGRLDDPLRAILYHEYSHVVTRHLTRGHCPVWLHEGLAEVFGRSQFDPPLERFPRALRENRLHEFPELEESLQHLPQPAVQLAYEQSYHFVAYLVDSFGWHVMHDLLAAYAEGLTTEAAFARAFGGHGLDFAAIRSQWEATARLAD